MSDKGIKNLSWYISQEKLFELLAGLMQIFQKKYINFEESELLLNKTPCICDGIFF